MKAKVFVKVKVFVESTVVSAPGSGSWQDDRRRKQQPDDNKFLFLVGTIAFPLKMECSCIKMFNVCVLFRITC